MKRPLLLIIASVLLVSCGPKGPSSSEIVKKMETDLPGFWEVHNFKIEEEENLGSKTDPVYKARFKTQLRAEEDTFVPEESVSKFFPFSPQPKVTYLNPSLEKGDTEEFYGVLAAEQYQDGWKIVFKFDNPPSEFGKPKSFYKGTAFVKGSKEEKAYQQQLAEQAEQDRIATLNRFFKGEHRGYLSGDLWGNATIKFTSASADKENVEGQFIFQRGVIKGFTGKLTPDELTLTVDRYIQGEDKTGLGTIYTLRISELTPQTPRIEGTWKHIDNRTGKVYFKL